MLCKKRAKRWLSTLLILVMLIPNASPVMATNESLQAGGYSSVPVGETWYDTDGNPIQAHGGGFLEKDGWYYWVGEDKTTNSAVFNGTNLYRSKDLLNWEFVEQILTVEHKFGDTDEDLSNCKVERPKLVYNEKHDKYVLWGHWETADSYSASELIVATSSEIDGPYEVKKHFRPGVGEINENQEPDDEIDESLEKTGYGSRDFTVYIDSESGNGYLISAQNHINMRVYPLTDDFADVDWRNSYKAFDGEGREAPALVKAGDYYFIFTSGQSGWYPNQLCYAYTKDISNPDGWSETIPVGNNTSFYSQPTNIMTIQGEDNTQSYVYMGDRWNPGKLGSSTYV